MLRIECLAPIKTPLVNKFYNAHKARGRATKQDDVWVVYVDYKIIAACRIQNTQESLFLSTLLVDPAWRGQGVAKKLLNTLLSSQTTPIYTFAYAHLVGFYKAVGFTQALTLPPSISTLFNVYKARNIVALHYI